MAEVLPPSPPTPAPPLVAKNNGGRASAHLPRPNTPFTPPLMLPPRLQGRPPFPPPRVILTSPIVHGGPSPNAFGYYRIGARPHGYFIFIPNGPPIPFHMPLPQPQLSCRPPYSRQVDWNRATMVAQRRGTGVFLPRPQPQVPVTNNVNANINKGPRNKQEARKARINQAWVPVSPGPSRSNGGIEEKKQKEECEDNNALSDELGLPKEWTY